MVRDGIDRRSYLSTLDVSSLFADCIEIFDIVVTSRKYEWEFLFLCTKLHLQRIRFVIWGEVLGLLPSPDGVSQLHDRAKHPADVRLASKEIATISHLSSKMLMSFIEKFQLSKDTLSQEQRLQRAASIRLPVFHDRFENSKERLRKSRQKQNYLWTINRWSVYNLRKFAAVIDKIAGLLDTLEDRTAYLGIPEQQQSLLIDEIESTIDEVSLRLLQDVTFSQQSSPVLLVVSDVIIHRLKLIAESMGSKAARSDTAGSTQSCDTSFTHQSHFSTPSVAEDPFSAKTIGEDLPILGTKICSGTMKGTHHQVSSLLRASRRAPPSMTFAVNISDTPTDYSSKAHTTVPVGTHVPAELCEACSTINLSMLVNGFRHALDFDQVLKSKDYCRFCALMMDAYDTQACIHLAGPRCEKVHRRRLIWKITPDGPGTRSGMFRLDYSHYGNFVRIYVSEGSFDRAEAKYTMIESSLFKSGILTQRDLQTTDSPRNLRLLREWLEECRLNHDECRYGSYSGVKFDDIAGSTTFPLRVIDVGSSDGSEPLRLVTTTYQKTLKYLTLSHCWGKIAPIKTMKATLAAWQVALPEKQLSKTFQDAIRLTRELAERFLWIDSLCIVQDDPSDLEAQIGLMGAIFEGSYCTIVAVDAKGVDGSSPDRGLFLSGPDNMKMARLWLRHESLINELCLQNLYNTEATQLLPGINGENSSTELHEVFLESIPTHRKGIFHLELVNKAWYSRGWIFQEKELSRRCIFFTEEMVAWKCNRYWETEQTGIPACRMRSSVVDLERNTTRGITYDASYHLRTLWEYCVKEYSGKKLTYVTDKSKALKGIEERLSTRFGATFRFGLLDFGPKEVLHSQLLWIPATSLGGSLRGDPNFLCHTWSWMTVKGPARWTTSDSSTHLEKLSEVSFGELTVDGRQELHVSGMCQAIKIGTSLGEIPRFTKSERWPPEIHFGISEELLDSHTNTVLSVTSGDIVE